MTKQKLKRRIVSGLLSATLVLTSVFEFGIPVFAEEPNAETVSENQVDSTSEPSDSTLIPNIENGTNQEVSAPSTGSETLDTENNEPSISGNNTPLDDSGSQTEPVKEKPTSYTVRFYTDSVTPQNLLFEYTVPYVEENGVNNTKLQNILPSSDAINTVYKGHQIYKWHIQGGSAKKPEAMAQAILTSDLDLVAEWRDKTYTFSTEFHLDGGSFDPKSEISAPTSFKVTSETLALPNAVRSGYLFGGWFKDAAFTTPISSIPTGSYVDSDKNGVVAAYTIYAKWVAVKPTAPKLSSPKNPSTGKVTVKWSSVSSSLGYELLISADKSFKKKKNKLDLGKKTSYSLTNMPKDKTYYFKVRSYQLDSTDSYVYSSYSSVKSLKIKKGVKEFTAKKDSAKLKKVSITNGTNLTVKATVSKRLKSSDDSYYLVKVDPVKGSVSKKIAASPKNKEVVFSLPVRDENGTNLIQGKYALAVKSGSKYKLISSASFISNPEAAATYKAAFPKAASKKGLQGISDVSLNVHHTFLNIPVNTMICQEGSGTPYKYNGKTYYFYDPFSGFIADANSKGITVTGQIMIQWYTPQSNKLILKSGQSAGHAYYAFDAQSKESRETLEALFSFMAECWSKENCHLDNWILGNEVNIHRVWYYAGNISEDTFMKNYADTFRILYYAVKGYSKNSRVYICTDHTFNNRCGDWGAKQFIELFNKKIKGQNKNIQWNLAYHAYPSVLTNSKVWDDNADPRFTTADTLASDFVSPYNLDVLTNYIKKNYGSKTRIILSEQGFTAYSGESIQAAAVAYSYYKAEFNDMIDAFLIHDVRVNTMEDYSFKNAQGQPRPAYNVFRYMNTPEYEKYTNSCLSTIGVSSWKQVTSKFNASKLKAMPMN